MRLSGTSMAAGVASGVVALVLQANPSLTPNAREGDAQYTAIPVRDDDGMRFDALRRAPANERRARSRWREPSTRRASRRRG